MCDSSSEGGPDQAAPTPVGRVTSASGGGGAAGGSFMPSTKANIITLPPMDPIPLTLKPTPERAAYKPVSRLDQIRGLLDLTFAFAEEAVKTAEVLGGNATGEAKYKFATGQVMTALERLEDRYDVIPGWLQGAAFFGAKMAVGHLVERAVKTHFAKG